jgi:hypothetical protein
MALYIPPLTEGGLGISRRSLVGGGTYPYQVILRRLSQIGFQRE